MWQTSTTKGQPREQGDATDRVWVLVDLSVEDPVYYLVPEWWMQNDIYTVHEQYLEEHGGQRAKSPDSTHHAIAITRIEKCRERWDVLGIF